MNYRLPQDRFIEIRERGGVIENNSNGYIEIAIINEDAQPVIDATTNKKVEENGKIFYQAEENQKIFARSISYIVADINVSEISKSEIDGDFDLNSYYTKTKTDELFVKKEGDKVLSDNNFTNELKGKLENIKAKDVSFDDGETFQQKLNENKLKGENGYTGVNGLNGLSMSISLEDGNRLIGKYIGDRILVGQINDTINNTYNSYEWQNIKAIKAINLPKEAKKLKVAILSFIGLTEEGDLVGTFNPSAKDGDNIYRYLKELDPTSKKTFEVSYFKEGVIPVDLKISDIKSKVLEKINQDFQSLGRVATKLGEVEYGIEVQGADGRRVGKLIIREQFINNIKSETFEIGNITTELTNLDGNKINKLTGYSKAEEKTAIDPTDSLLVALGKLEKGLETLAPSMVVSGGSQSNPFHIHYCTEMEYQGIEKIRDDSTIYMVLNEETGDIKLKVYRP